MTTCTMLADKHSDIDLTTEDMLLCSVVQMGIKSQKNKNIRNSTVLAACDTINEDFVPNEISAIEGKNFSAKTDCAVLISIRTPSIILY